jgi:integrase
VDSVWGRVLKDGLKTQQKRKFPINEQLREVLSVHREFQIQPIDFVFPSPKGRFLNIHNFRNRGGDEGVG